MAEGPGDAVAFGEDALLREAVGGHRGDQDGVARERRRAARELAREDGDVGEDPLRRPDDGPEEALVAAHREADEVPREDAAGGEAVAAELEELEGRQVEGDAVGEVGVEEDGVPRALLAHEERTAVADEDAVVGVGAEVEVLPGDADDLGVDLDGGRRDLRGPSPRRSAGASRPRGR